VLGVGLGAAGAVEASGGFIRASVRLPLSAMPWIISASPVAFSAPQPPAGSL
jgi:hypothetical protein